MKRCLFLILLVSALAVPAAASATPTFGAGVDSDFFNQTWGIWSPTQTVSSLKALYSAGGRVGRADTHWSTVEPNAPKGGHHTYNWSYDDTLAGEMAQARVRWEPTLQGTPKWAQAHRSNTLHLKTGKFVVTLPPGNNATFATYATAFMKRYGAHGAFWSSHRNLPYEPVTTVEVWNEPDNTHNWGPTVNLQDYAKEYEAVRTAVHRVNRGAHVMTGGLAWTRSSLPRLLKAFVHKPIDEVAIHPYASTPAGTVALAKWGLAEMRAYGRGSTPVVVNEYGWTSERNTWGTTQAKHVKPYAYAALIGLAKLRLAQILPFEWADASWGLNDGPYAQAVAKITHKKRG